MHGDVAVAETDAVRYGGGGAAARTRREGVASAALPDLDLYVTAVDDFEELHIGAIREGWVHFDQSAIFVCLLGGDFVLHQHTVRVADVGDIDGLCLAVKSRRLINLVRFVRFHRTDLPVYCNKFCIVGNGR